jgi:hypothetical protein
MRFSLFGKLDEMRAFMSGIPLGLYKSVFGQIIDDRLDELPGNGPLPRHVGHCPRALVIQLHENPSPAPGKTSFVMKGLCRGGHAVKK